jgi:hypothetical protein
MASAAVRTASCPDEDPRQYPRRERLATPATATGKDDLTQMTKSEAIGRQATVTRVAEILADTKRARDHVASHSARRTWEGTVQDAHICSSRCTHPGSSAPGELGGVCISDSWLALGIYDAMPGELRIVTTIEFTPASSGPAGDTRPA